MSARYDNLLTNDTVTFGAISIYSCMLATLQDENFVNC